MLNPEDYQPDEKVIKDGQMLLKFRESPFYNEVKELIDSEIRVQLRILISNDATMDELKMANAKASSLRTFLEMVDGKINDMEVWLAQQQQKSEQDMREIDEMVAFHQDVERRRAQEMRVM